MLAPVLRFKTADLAVKRGWRPKAGLTDRNTGTGVPEGTPARAAVEQAPRHDAQKNGRTFRGGRAPVFSELSNPTPVSQGRRQCTAVTAPDANAGRRRNSNARLMQRSGQLSRPAVAFKRDRVTVQLDAEMGLPYSLEELQDFIARHEAASVGAVDRDTALRWWQLGWVDQVELGSERWKPTANGLEKIANPPT